MNASILGPLTLCLNHGHKPIRHGIEHFFPVIRPLAQDVPTGIVKTVSFDAALLKFDDISPYVFDRIHINGHPSISPHTFSIGFIYMDTLRRPRQNFDFVPMLNESFFFTMRDVWMGDWSWTSFTFWSGNIALMEGRKTFCKISRFFSFTNFPSNLTKSCLGHHSRNIPTPELMSARSVEHIEYVRNRTAFHFFGTRKGWMLIEVRCDWLLRIPSLSVNGIPSFTYLKRILYNIITYIRANFDA